MHSVRPSRAHSASGFTLVEVIVVLAVVLLLTGIAVPMISGYMEDGRRARAAAEVKMLGAAVLSFQKDVGGHPARNSTGTDNRLNVLLTGPSIPSANPWRTGHRFATWGMNASTGDRIDNHLLVNAPGGNAAAAYPTTGELRWRGPYLPTGSPLDPWGRPYVINVISGWSTSATNNRKVFVLSAGENGVIDTNFNATALDEIAGDDIGMVLGQRR